ncbi:hypothetical protein [Streptomyces sp. NBC_00582]|uniref:hypothetical protein n=1 Tax=Streptomyces sp. NBC_00582 TaxID=2975783 RepID=UPI002E816CA5|nr:hypothetical protein [Streptomyces sp. NBC_00582]WUB60840.1 hypothetical protein OG852_10800 [Streptomyces sp. NBC_00582]
MRDRGLDEALESRFAGLAGPLFIQVDGGGSVHRPRAQLAVDERVGGERQTGASVPEVVSEPGQELRQPPGERQKFAFLAVGVFGLEQGVDLPPVVHHRVEDRPGRLE